ncbi:MAG: hypothetical protein ACJA0X_001346 [Cyclobacteriaceae bacterium]|jgi:hypothetical protein
MKMEITEAQARELWSSQLAQPLAEKETQALAQFLSANPAIKEELDSTSMLWDNLAKMEIPSPSDHMDQKFDAFMAQLAQPKVEKMDVLYSLSIWFETNWKVGVGALAIGLIIGLALSPNKEATKVDQLASEVSDLKKMMVLSLIEKPQAQDRIRAVSMVSEVRKADASIVDVLIETMNKDKSLNVRLASIDALVQYGNDEEVRSALIKTIPRQSSPLVLVTLADALVQIQAKEAASEFQKMMDNKNVDPSIKSKLKSTIQTLKEI